MPTFYSDIVAPREATPPVVTNGEKNGAYVRAIRFSASVPATAVAGDRVDLCELPEGCLIVGGHVSNGALTGVTAARLRTENSATAFQAADVSLASAAVHTIDTPAKGTGYRPTRFDVDASAPGGLRFAKERLYYSLVTGNASAPAVISGTIYFTA